MKKSNRVKSSLQKELEIFLRENGNNLETCAPEHIRNFLIWKDKFGKTPIHIVDCPFLASKEPALCECPRRLSSKTLEITIGRLKSIVSKVEDRLGPNPVDSELIRTYLDFVREEQALAHVQPKQATPIFGPKIRRLIVHIIEKSTVCKDRLIFLREAAFFKLLAFGGDRAGDLGYVKFQEVKAIQDSGALMVSRSFGKNLKGRGGTSVNTYVLQQNPLDEVMCPVAGLRSLANMFTSRGIPLTGYIFRPIEMGSANLPMSYGAAYNRLKLYLGEMEEDAGETPTALEQGPW